MKKYLKISELLNKIQSIECMNYFRFIIWYTIQVSSFYQMKMQNGFKDLTLFDLDGDSRLYVVDSINNLHRANTCDEPCGPILSKY